MAKYSKSELLKTISDNENIDIDLKTTLLEDITDSFADDVVATSEYEKLKTQVDDLAAQLQEAKERYVARFSGDTESKNNVAEVKDVRDEVQETYVDVSEI